MADNPFDQFDKTQGTPRDPGANLPISRDISTITGKPTPTGEEYDNAVRKVVAPIVRYGPPVAAGFMTGGLGPAAALATEAGVTALSEITARQIENAATDPELDSIWQDIKAGGAAGAMDLVVGGGMYGLGRTMSAVARKMFLPREMPADIELAQTILGSFGKEGQKNTRKWVKWKEGDPFSLTLGQLNHEETGFVTFLESVARGGSGAKIMRKFDIRNENQVAEALDLYFRARIAEQTPTEIATTFRRLFGEVNNPGEAFKPIETYKTFLYKQFDDFADAIPEAVVDGNGLRDYIRNSTDSKILSIYNQLKSLKLVPPLDGIETRIVRKSRSTVQTSSTKAGTDVADVTKTNLLDPNATPKRTKVQTDSERASGSTRETFTENTRVILQDPRATKEEVDAAWKSLKIADADKAMRTINSYYEPVGDEAFNNQLQFMRQQLQKPFNKEISKHGELLEIYETAKQYNGAKGVALRNATIKKIRKLLPDTPSAIADYIDPLSGSPAVAYDRLKRIKKTLYFAADVPDVLVSSTGKEVRTGAISRSQAWQEYQKNVLRPIQFRFVNNATTQGRLDPKKLLGQIAHLRQKSPEMLSELWGSPTQAKHIEDLASTMMTMQDSKPGKSVFIQLQTAAAIGATAGAAFTYFRGDNPVIGGIGGASLVLLSPIAFAKVLTNASLTRQLTDGFRDSLRKGGIAPSLAMTLRKIGQMKIASTLFRENPSANIDPFYQFDVRQEQASEQQ